MQKHFVTFYSPGTFVAETNMKEIPEWDVKLAVEMSRNITQRYNAKPYGFTFSTRERKDDELDSREVKTSPIYYLGGTILTLEDVIARNDPKDKTLISNMRINNYKRIIENRNSWLFTRALNDKDVVLDYEV